MLKKIKAQAIAFTLIATLTNNTANAVYPVFDSGNLQQNITSYIQDGVAQAKDYAMQMQQYTQQLKEYAQMVQDTLNFEKQMESMDVNLRDIYAIYGDTMEIINTSMNLYQEILDLPDNVYGRFEKAFGVCAQIGNLPQAKNLKNALNTGKSLKGKFSSCATALSNSGAFIKDITAITDEIVELEA